MTSSLLHRRAPFGDTAMIGMGGLDVVHHEGGSPYLGEAFPACGPGAAVGCRLTP